MSVFMADLSLSLSLFPFFYFLSTERAKIFLQKFFLPWKSDWGRRSSRGYFLRKRYALRVRFSFAPFPSTATDSTDKRGVSKKENGYIEREWTRGRLIQF